MKLKNTRIKNNALRFSLIATAVSTMMFSTSILADQQILDDLIVQGSICSGTDCVNGESFGFDTIKLKENNLRIKFQDTSNTASFPSTDWQITINDSTNGGKNKFAIEDTSAAKIPFTIEGGAPSNSLYIEDGGRIGVGTTTPVVEMHIVNGDSPTLRLEQDGSSGFTPQTWDVAGNETNFFIRDATNGSPLPFRIRPTAPQNSLYIDTDGDVGMLTASPDAQLHVVGNLLAGPSDLGTPTTTATIHAWGNDGTTSLKVEDTSTTASPRGLLSLVNHGGSYILMDDTNTGKQWYLVHANASPNDFMIQHSTGGQVFKLAETGNLTISGTLTTSGTTCSGGCDLVFSKDFPLESIEEHAELMWKNQHLPAVGKTIENQPFNLTEKTGGMLNELEKAHIYIEQLHKQIKVKDKEIKNIYSKLAEIEERLLQSSH